MMEAGEVALRRPASSDQRQQPARAACHALDLGAADHEGRAARGHLIEVRHAFEAPASRPEPGIMEAELLRGAVVEREGVDRDARDVSPDEGLRDVGVEAREVERTPEASALRNFGVPTCLSQPERSAMQVPAGIAPC